MAEESRRRTGIRLEDPRVGDLAVLDLPDEGSGEEEHLVEGGRVLGGGETGSGRESGEKASLTIKKQDVKKRLITNLIFFHHLFVLKKKQR